MEYVFECRSCGSSESRTLVDLGYQPLSNAYLPSADASDPKYPLHVQVCGSCFLVQVPSVVPREEIFTADYAYFSSFSSSWVEHARRFCKESKEKLSLDENSLVIEVASNDGYLLRHFKEFGVPTLGIEPTLATAEAARALGIPVVTEFFGVELAERLASEGKQADLLIGNNVLAHVPDLNDFIAGISKALKPEGAASFEFPHLLRMIESVEFDTIYHEHFSYFSLFSVSSAMARHGLRVFNVEELSTHGGSLRLWISHENSSYPTTSNVQKVLDDEKAKKLHTFEGYEEFSSQIEECRASLLAFFQEVASDGKSVAGYGAAAKGNTLLNYCHITSNEIKYVVDQNPHKQNKFLPGSHIPINDPSRMSFEPPDYVLILPWNLKTEIVNQLKDVLPQSRFVTAIPKTTVL